MGLVDVLRNSAELARATRGKEFKWASKLPTLPEIYEGPDDVDPEPVPLSPQIVVTRQWGLRLPSGEVMWNSFQGVPFDNPMDRVHMIAKLQQTAQDVGFDSEEFLSRYGWATRNQVAAVVYEDIGTHALADQEVTQPDNQGEES